MSREAVTILDAERNVIATADVECRKGVYFGSANMDQLPKTLRRLFEQYEEIVNDQVFSLLDPIEDQIGTIPLVVVFGDGRESQAKDLQIFPKGNTISFKVGEPVMLSPALRKAR